MVLSGELIENTDVFDCYVANIFFILSDSITF